MAALSSLANLVYDNDVLIMSDVLAEYDPDDFIVLAMPSGSVLVYVIPDERSFFAFTFDHAQIAHHLNMTGHVPYAYSYGSDRVGFREDQIPIIGRMQAMAGKRSKIDMAGDCLAATFSYWSTASEGERSGLVPRMVAELKLSEHVFAELSNAIPAPKARASASLPCTDFFRGYLNRFYAQGKRHSGKRPLLDVAPDARRQVMLRAAATLRGKVQQWSEMTEPANGTVKRSVEESRALWGNPVLLMIADELEGSV